MVFDLLFFREKYHSQLSISVNRNAWPIVRQKMIMIHAGLTTLVHWEKIISSGCIVLFQSRQRAVFIILSPFMR
jgi:hypothetical protein